MMIVQHILRSFKMLPSIKQVYFHFSTDRNFIRSNNTKKRTDIVSRVVWRIRIKKTVPSKAGSFISVRLLGNGKR